MAAETGLIVESGVPVPLADGTVLSADVFRPAGSGRSPVILVRTPYGKEAAPALLATYGVEPLALARAGHAVVIQDARGTGASGGVFRPMRDEGKDGAESLAWAASQPWATGAVAMAGPSYLGATQLLAAAEAPPALRAIAPVIAYGPEFVRQGGAFRLGFNLWWCVRMALAQLERQHGADGGVARGRLEAIVADPSAAYRRLPLLDVAAITPWLESTYGEWLRRPQGDGVWRPAAGVERSPTVSVPALHVAGWHDLFLTGSLTSYTALRANAATERARANQRLLITPWSHAPSGAVVGELWLGGDAMLELQPLQLEWFGAWLKNEPLRERHPVQLFVQGANRWRDEPEWPLARAVSTRWYLRAGGRLTREPPAGEPPVSFVYDPRDPVPTASGQGAVGGRDGAFSEGPRDRRRVHDRRDVLLYTSATLEHDLEVTGPVNATLYVASSARDTDFTVTLLDVYPDGRAIGLTDGILRLRYRNGLDRPELLQPGRVYEIAIDLIATSNVFLAGHRVAVEISSSNFPRFDRNPNHGGCIAEATEGDLVAATQRVFHDADRASHITLPEIPAGARA